MTPADLLAAELGQDVLVEIDTAEPEPAPKPKPKPQPASAVPPTELGMATLVMADNPDLRFVPGLGWHKWDGYRWSPDSGESALIASVLRAAHWANSGQITTRTRGYASNRGLEDIAKLCEKVARTDTRLLDADPQLLHTAGITWDLATGESRPTDPAELNTRATGLLPAADACPRWLQFLDECFPGEPDVPRYLQRLVGYGLTSRGDQSLFVVFQGHGANGKSTFVTAISNALGAYTTHLPIQVLMANRAQSNGEQASPQLLQLRGARLVFTSESDRDGRLDEAKVKLLTGGDEISVRGLYKDPVRFTPRGQMFMSTNHLPEIQGRDMGIWRRVKVVEWRESFEHRKDVTLARQLALEAPGIIQWAIDGAVAYHRDGLGPEPQRVKSSVAAYRDESDFLFGFVPDFLVKDPTAFVSRADLIAMWHTFEDATGRSPLKNNGTLYDALKERGFTQHKSNGVQGFRARRATAADRQAADGAPDAPADPDRAFARFD